MEIALAVLLVAVALATGLVIFWRVVLVVLAIVVLALLLTGMAAVARLIELLS